MKMPLALVNIMGYFQNQFFEKPNLSQECAVMKTSLG